MLSNLDLKNKFNLLLILIFLLGVNLSGLALSRILYQQAEHKLTDEGQILMQIMEEVKYYTSANLLELYQRKENQQEFNVSFIPAYAAKTVFDNFKDMAKFKNYDYKEATINPTNLEDRPDKFEQNLIDSFSLNRNLKILSGYTNKSQQKFYFISRPLVVKDQSCLQCHSTPDIAPQKMLEIYGGKNGFNWELNQLTSAQTIYIPANNIASNVRQRMLTFMPIFTGIFAILILAINRLLQYTVVKPINQLAQVANQLRDNNYNIILDWRFNYLEKLRNRGDETGKLAQAIWSMAENIFYRDRNLQETVKSRTKELRAEIKERELIEQKLAKQIKRVLLQEKITQEIRHSLDTDKILQTAVNNVGRAFKVSRCQIFTYCETNPSLAKVVAEYIVPQHPRTLGLEVSLYEAICLKSALSQEKAACWSNVYDTPLLRPCIHIYEQLEINSLLTVRTSYLGKINGAISIQQCDRMRQWHQDEVELLESVAAQVGIALAQAGLLQQEKQRSQEIEVAKKEAELANRAKSEFLANISHELRTPLNAIIGFSQLMNRDPATNPEQQETINIINRSGEHLLEMIDEVLEMSKIEAGKIELQITNFDLKVLLNTIESMLSIKAKAKNLQLLIECSPEVPDYIYSDESKLRQVLINLIGNGIKFTQAGKVTLRVSQENINDPSACLLRFEVEDTGAGITPEELPRIFQAFGQSETGRLSKQGTGLGLPISQKFVEMLGGELTVRSQVGIGSIFSFYITTQIGELSPIKLTSLKSVKSLAPSQSSYRILVVDDVWQSRLLIIKFLVQVGFEVKEAENGKQALEISQQWQPHLILMDMRMPIMDGYKSTQAIRAAEQLNSNLDHHIKIIALTASAFESKRAATIQAGCNDYLRKPFKESELFAKIKGQLGVEYIYQEDSNNDPQQKSQAETQPFQLTPNCLQMMSDEWLREFKQAAAELNETKLVELIQQIPDKHNSLAQALKELVNNFQFERLFELG